MTSIGNPTPSPHTPQPLSVRHAGAGEPAHCVTCSQSLYLSGLWVSPFAKQESWMETHEESSYLQLPSVSEPFPRGLCAPFVPRPVFWLVGAVHQLCPRSAVGQDESLGKSLWTR